MWSWKHGARRRLETTSRKAAHHCFRLDGGEGATLSFETPVVERRISLDEIRQGPVIVDAGGVDMRVTFEMAPLGSGREASVELRDSGTVAAGRHAYWVRVTQVDGQKAWVSPFYVTIVDQ